MKNNVKKVIVLGIVCVVIFFPGCKPEEDPVEFVSEICSGEGSGDVTNFSGSVVQGYEYLDLDQGCSVSITGTTITGVIKVDDIPDSGTLIFNHEDIGIDYLEYRWGIEFDTNGDSTFDYIFSISHFKFSDEEIEGNIETNTQVNLWKHGEESTSSLTSGMLILDVVNDTFTIKATHSEVSKLVNSEIIEVRTFMDDGSGEEPFEDSCW